MRIQFAGDGIAEDRVLISSGEDFRQIGFSPLFSPPSLCVFFFSLFSPLLCTGDSAADFPSTVYLTTWRSRRGEYERILMNPHWTIIRDVIPGESKMIHRLVRATFRLRTRRITSRVCGSLYFRLEKERSRRDSRRFARVSKCFKRASRHDKIPVLLFHRKKKKKKRRNDVSRSKSFWRKRAEEHLSLSRLTDSNFLR